MDDIELEVVIWIVLVDIDCSECFVVGFEFLYECLCVVVLELCVD